MLSQLRQASGEQGASAVAIAATLFVLLGMAAIATDVGAGFGERRQSQNAADVSALGGALWSTISTAPNPLQDALDQAKQVAAANTDTALTWGSCTDSGALFWTSDDPSLNLIGGTPCVSFSRGFTTVRVKIPDQSIETTFGRVLGAAQLTTNASAEASISAAGLSGAFPSGVLGSSSAGSQFCIKTGPNDNESCGAPSTGDFQNFKPYFYTEIDPSQNPTSVCTSGEQTDPISRAMADGIDHLFGIAPGAGAGNRVNGDGCPAAPLPPFPDRVDSAAGYQNTDITNGLISGGNWDGAFDGRLDRGSFQSGPLGAPSAYGALEIFDTTIDNRPLWDFIDRSKTSVTECDAIADLGANPDFSNGSITVGGSFVLANWDDAAALLGQCLSGESGELFDEDDLLSSPRLAAVPRYHQTTPLGSNACCYDIQEFVPIFINSVWTSHSNQFTCDDEIVVVDGDLCRHDAGMTGQISVAAPGQKRIDSASAWILKCSHFSPETCSVIENGAGGTASILSRIELTR